LATVFGSWFNDWFDWLCFSIRMTDEGWQLVWQLGRLELATVFATWLGDGIDGWVWHL
jgi:hypothetical protein